MSDYDAVVELLEPYNVPEEVILKLLKELWIRNK